MQLLETFELTEIRRFSHATCYLVKERPDILVVEATSVYIPKTQFQEIFIALGQIIINRSITKLVFDKRSLKVFHQPSMEWYFVVWKELMFHHGLRTHRKLLPNDEVFKHSVNLSREKIHAKHPFGKYAEMDIQYCSSLEEAIAN